MTNFKNKSKNRSSSRLCSSSSFIIGMGSVLNISGSYFNYNYSNTGTEADNKAIQRDWEIIGQELFNAIPVIEK